MAEDFSNDINLSGILVKEDVDYGKSEYGPENISFTWEQACEINRRIRLAFKIGSYRKARGA